MFTFFYYFMFYFNFGWGLWMGYSALNGAPALWGYCVLNLGVSLYLWSKRP